MTSGRHHIFEGAKVTLLVCIVSLQVFWLWEVSIQPELKLASLKAPLQDAVIKCANERDYQRRVSAALGGLDGKTFDYLRRSFVISNEPCRQQELFELELLASNVSQAEVNLIKRTTGARGL